MGFLTIVMFKRYRIKILALTRCIKTAISAFGINNSGQWGESWQQGQWKEYPNKKGHYVFVIGENLEQAEALEKETKCYGVNNVEPNRLKLPVMKNTAVSSRSCKNSSGEWIRIKFTFYHETAYTCQNLHSPRKFVCITYLSLYHHLIFRCMGNSLLCLPHFQSFQPINAALLTI